MKKLALSLVLTLGVSGVALASNGKVEKEKQPVKKEVSEVRDDCLVADVYVSEGLCSGERKIKKTTHLSNDCGEAEGGVLFQMHAVEYVDDCNWGEIFGGY